MASYADAVLSRLGQVNATSDGSFEQDNALFLKVFAGEVLTAFEETNVFKDLHLIRTIKSGKSASFPATWKATARYHTPGTPVLGSNTIPHNERVISIDDLLLSDVVIADIDDAKNHYDVRQIYSKELGAALAREFDKRIARIIVNAARASATVTGGNGGTVLKNTAAATDSDVLASMMFEAAQALDEKDIPSEDRYITLSPAQYYLLVQNTKVLNKDWNGAGSYADALLPKIAGFTIKMSNNIPHDNYEGVSGEHNDYTGDFTDTVGMAFHKTAAGTVKLMDLSVQKTGNDFQAMYQGTLMVARYAMGHGILRPECSVEISKAAETP